MLANYFNINHRDLVEQQYRLKDGLFYKVHDDGTTSVIIPGSLISRVLR